MPFNSRNKGSECVSMTWWATAWQVLLTMSKIPFLSRMYGETLLVNHVAGNICQGPPLTTCVELFLASNLLCRSHGI